MNKRLFERDHTIKEALGQSDPFLAVQEQLSRVASVDRPVLILGERGTGKELAASRIHYLSKRWQNAFVALNCAALNPSLIESELFGHEPGAFTGAMQRRKGRFEMAHQGTLFLDEIGTMPMIVQEKILRAIEYGTFERVGGSVSVQVDVRIVAATNVDLSKMVNNGSFKQDLLDRLCFEVIVVPPLRQRKEDILLLARHFATQMAIELELDTVPQFSDTVTAQLLKYQWPGNIRELKNVIERAVYNCNTRVISDIMINPFYSRSVSALQETVHESEKKQQLVKPDISGECAADTMDLKNAVAALEKKLLRAALHKAQYNQKQAADLLGLRYHQFRGLYRKYKEHEERGSE